MQVQRSALEILSQATQVVQDGGGVNSHTSCASLRDAIQKCEQNFEPICTYLENFPREQHKPALVLVAAVELHLQQGLPLFVLSHAPVRDISAHASETMLVSLMPEMRSDYDIENVPAVVKTVTLSVLVDGRYRHFLVTQLGDQMISDEEYRSISEATGVSLSRLKKHSTINFDFDPITHFGREPGMVGPFPDYVSDVDGLIYLEEPVSMVALRYTPSDTVLMARELFEELLQAYNQSIGLPIYVLKADVTDSANAD